MGMPGMGPVPIFLTNSSPPWWGMVTENQIIMIEGSCHCGLVKWTYTFATESVTACNCSLCRRYGALWAYGYLQTDAQVEGSTTAYMWGNRYSGFNFCLNCGCLAYYLANKPDQEGNIKIAVNIRMAINPEQVQDLRIDQFDGHDKFEDLPSTGKRVKDLWF